MVSGLTELTGRAVVLDTAGPIVYLGMLSAVVEGGFWLESADVHDCRDGHASKEAYLLEAKEQGVTVNRRRVFVMASTVISASALDDVIAE